MPVKVFLSSTLRKYIKDYNAVEGIILDVKKETTIKELCHEIGIPPEEVKIAVVDGKSRNLDYILKGNERIGLFPAIGGG